MTHLLLALWRRPVGLAFRERRCIDQSRFAALGEVFAPAVKARPADPDRATPLGEVPELCNLSKYPQYALNVALILGHEHLFCPAKPSLEKIFRQ